MTPVLPALAAALLAAAADPAPIPPAGAVGDQAFARQVLGPPAGSPLSGEALERRTNEVSAVIRCPVCQGSSVADSPSTMAQNMKAEVRTLLARGYDAEQVIQYFERSYGEFVRMEPKAEGFNALLWLMPALVLLGGAGTILLMTRRMRRPQPNTSAAPHPLRQSLPSDPQLARHVREVRAQVYGWPGGEPPASDRGGQP